MLGIFLKRSIAVLVCTLLAACAVIDRSVAPRVTSLNFSVDQAVNESILTNILRASQTQPLTFVAISKIGGTQTVTLNNGLPTFSFGPDLTAAQKQFVFGNNSLSNNANGNFDIAHLNTRDFARGLMAPIAPVELDLVLKQSVTRELLFHLVFEGFEYTKLGQRKFLPNDPRHDAYSDFQLALGLAVKAGFTIETRPKENPFYDSNDKSGAYPRIVTQARFCFDPILNRTGVSSLFNDKSWLCGGKWAGESPFAPRTPKEAKKAEASRKAAAGSGSGRNQTAASRTLDPNPRRLAAPSFIDVDPRVLPPGVSVGPISDVVVRIRSLHEVFGFLGQLLADGMMDRVLVQEEPELNSTVRSPLLVVVTDRRHDCFAEIRFDGRHYCVPMEASANTKRIFSIVSQLIALKTQAGDVPFFPSVRVVP